MCQSNPYPVNFIKVNGNWIQNQHSTAGDLQFFHFLSTCFKFHWIVFLFAIFILFAIDFYSTFIPILLKLYCYFKLLPIKFQILLNFNNFWIVYCTFLQFSTIFSHFSHILSVFEHFHVLTLLCLENVVKMCWKIP